MKALACLFALLFAGSATAQVKCVETDDAILVRAGEKPVLRYNKTVREAPEGMDPRYRRSGYIHPVYDPAGRVVTGDFAADHPHQHALFFAWTKCEFEGRKVEFWDQKLGIGRVSHDAVLSVEDGEFKVRMLYEDTNDAKNPKPVLHEIWTVRVHDTAGDKFVFDLTSEQSCAGKSPLVIKQYHYGAMAIRGHDQWFGEDAGFLTNEGKTRENGNHSRPNWVSMFGKIDGKTSAVAVFCHPSNFRYPQHVRLHPKKPYFCFAPMVTGEFRIEPGNPYVSRYRYVVHGGKPDKPTLETLWQAFAKE